MEVDFKHNIKTEPTDNYEIEEQKLPEQPNGLDNEVVQEVCLFCDFPPNIKKLTSVQCCDVMSE
jgi:hypothetical protein